jgi:hypothetical protein
VRPSLLLCLLAPAVLGADPPAPFLRLAELEITRQADADFAEERALYWRKCALALQSRRDSRSHALRGVGLFLATVPLEYAISRHRHTRQAEPVALNATAFVLMGATLFHLSRSYRRWEHYERDRGCCRLWQEYAKPPTAKVAAADPPCVGPSRPFHLAQNMEEGY